LSKLALLGGTPVREKLFPAYEVIGEEEKVAVAKVMDTGVLSKYLGAQHEDFMGGPQVRAFEEEWAEAFQAKYAFAVNSATSGLYATVGAAGIGPGDEVIVSPYTMMASVTAAIVFNAVPIFADVHPKTFCLDPVSIRKKITQHTKAIIVVHIFGQIADMDAIMAIAEEYNLTVIEDCAQSPFATYNGRPCGTLGHMGVFSLNYHKHIHTGEGGVVTTNDAGLAERISLIRNHGEAVVGRRGVKNIQNIIGFNFRMGEIEAAIGRCQLKKGPILIQTRRDNVAYLEQRMGNIKGITLPVVANGNEHVYYIHAMTYDATIFGVSRQVFVDAIRAELPPTELREAEGPLIGMGYVRPIYLEPIFQQRLGYGETGCPFTCPHYKGAAKYEKGMCPNAEKAHFESLMSHEMMRPPMSKEDLDDVADAFVKVAENIEDLR
jgi:dTDP-4-amino-4,6-dideoxygalactose transaminase